MPENIEVKIKVDSKEAGQSVKDFSSKIEDSGKSISKFEGNQKNLGKELVSNRKLTEGLSKVTGGMSDALMEATKGIDLTKLSLKGMKSAIMSTGIGLLVVAVGELISYLAEFYSAEKKSERAVESLNEALESQQRQFDETSESAKFANQLASKYAKLNGESAEQLHKRSQEYHKSEINRIQKQIEANAELSLSILANADLTDEAKDEQLKKNREYMQKLMDQQKGLIRNSKMEEADFQLEQKAERERANADRAAKQKSAAEKAAQDKKAEQDKIKALQSKHKLELENLEDDTEQKKLDRQKLRAQEELNLVKMTAKQKAELLKKIDEEFAIKQAELDAKNAEAKKKKEEEEAQKAYDKRAKDREDKLLGLELEMEEDNTTYEQKRALLLQRQATMLEDEKLTENQRLQIKKETTEATKQLDEGEYQSKMALLGATANAMEVASSVIGKQTAVGKGLSVAAALMNTYQGISAGVKLGYPQSIPAIAMASLTGFAAVRNILAVKVPKSSGSGSGSASTPSMSKPSATMPNFNVIGNSGVNQIAQTLGAQQPVQAYVVANNVTTAQSLDRNIIQNASMG
jgi:hypothetical protein